MAIRKIALVIGLVLATIALLACQFDYLRALSSPTRTPTRTAARTATPARPSAPPTIAVISTLPPPRPPPTQPQSITATATDNVRVRSAPSASGQVLTTLKQGDTADATGRTEGGDWVQIILPANPNLRGWVSAQYLTLSGPIDSMPIMQSGSPSAPPPVVPPSSYPYP